MKDRVIRVIRNLFGHEEEDYCKLVKVGTFSSNKHIGYESNGDNRKKNYKLKNILIKLDHT